jgi:hypothetical protein
MNIFLYPVLGNIRVLRLEDHQVGWFRPLPQGAPVAPGLLRAEAREGDAPYLKPSAIPADLKERKWAPRIFALTSIIRTATDHMASGSVLAENLRLRTENMELRAQNARLAEEALRLSLPSESVVKEMTPDNLIYQLWTETDEQLRKRFGGKPEVCP